MNTPDALNGGQWVSTSEAAAALRVSERTIQRRAASGELTARKVVAPDGEKWEIQLSAATLVTPVASLVPPQIHAQNRVGADSGAKVPTIATTGADTSDAKGDATTEQRELDAMRAQLVEQLKGENQFLRAALEQRDRDAAELRAALRKALEIAPRQLADGTPTKPREAPLTGAMKPERGRDTRRAPSPANRRGDGLALVRAGVARIFGHRRNG